MELLKVDSVEKAREKLIKAVSSWELPTETVALSEATRRILAEDVRADDEMPSFDRSTVDGYAVKSMDTAGAGDSIPVFLTLSGRVEMGRPADGAVSSGECMYVPTGGMLPAGADAVVMTEYCEKFGSGKIAVSQPVSSGRNVIVTGSDAKSGEVVVPRGRYLRPQDVGALAMAGVSSPTVFRRPTVAVISTGDELVPCTSKPSPGEVRDINSSALAAAAANAGMLAASVAVVADDEALLARTVREAMSTNDLVLVSGGSSQGDKDATRKIFDAVARPGVFTHGLAMKPGKPTIFAVDDATRTLLAGLPGHPAAALMVFERTLLWLWEKLTGASLRVTRTAEMLRNVPGAPGRETCQPVRLLERAGQLPAAEPIFGESGLITTLSEASGYIVIGRNTEGVKVGERQDVSLF